MRRSSYLVAFCLLALPACSPKAAKKPAAPDEPAAQAKPVHESWHAAYLEGVKIGHSHVASYEGKNRDGEAIVRTTRTLDLVIKRYGSVVPVRQEQVSDETPEGKVLYLEETLTLGKAKNGPLSGHVRAGKLLLTVGDDPRVRPIDFPDDVRGPYFQENYFAKVKKDAGAFSLKTFELMTGTALTLSGKVGAVEETDRLKLDKDGKVGREAVRLTRVDLEPVKVKQAKEEVELPGETLWLDAKRVAVRKSFAMPGAGTIVLYSTTKEAALKEGIAPELLPDLGLQVSIPLAQTIDKPYETTEAVYRVSLDVPMDKVFTADARQTIRNKTAKGFDLAVTSGRSEGAPKPGREYTDSSPFIECDDDEVVALTRRAVGTETDPLAIAKRVEKWVHENMKLDTSIGFPSAARIARDLKGDCRQHALLMAAMCRAAKVPARTVIGLLYVREQGRSPTLGFHMWAEVWVNGDWVGMDAILGKGGMDAVHLKMGDHSWAETVTLAPLLPIARTLGKLKVELVSAK